MLFNSSSVTPLLSCQATSTRRSGSEWYFKLAGMNLLFVMQ